MVIRHSVSILDLLEMQILTPHSRPTELETLGGVSKMQQYVLINLQGNSDEQLITKTIGLGLKKERIKMTPWFFLGADLL